MLLADRRSALIPKGNLQRDDIRSKRLPLELDL